MESENQLWFSFKMNIMLVNHKKLYSEHLVTAEMLSLGRLNVMTYAIVQALSLNTPYFISHITGKHVWRRSLKKNKKFCKDCCPRKIIFHLTSTTDNSINLKSHQRSFKIAITSHIILIVLNQLCYTYKISQLYVWNNVRLNSKSHKWCKDGIITVNFSNQNQQYLASF